MQVPIKTGAGYDRGHGAGNRPLAIGSNAEMRLNLHSASTAEHKHLLGIGSSQHFTLRSGKKFPQGHASLKHAPFSAASSHFSD